MHRKRITPITFDEIYTLDEAKRHARIEHDDDDQFILSIIPTARAIIEQYCLISIVPHKFIVTLDVCDLCEVIQLQQQTEIASVEAFTVTDADGTETAAVEDEDFRISNNRLILDLTKDIFSNLRARDCIDIEYISAVHEPVQAIKDAHGMIISHLYENREAIQNTSDSAVMKELTIGIATILAPFKNYAV